MRTLITPREVNRDLLNALKDEGATIVEVRNGSNHARLTYTFDGTKRFTTTVHRHRKSTDHRELYNFRAQIRRNKRQ